MANTLVQPVRSKIRLAERGLALSILDWAPAGEPAAPAYLLVHGLASNARLWDAVSAELASAGHRVLAVDQRGHGHSDTPDDGYDFASVTSDLVGLLDALDIGEVVVAGQSWGGNVALDLASRHPDRITGVVCVDGGMIALADRFPEWSDCAEALAPPRLAGMKASRITAGIRAAHPSWPEAGIEGALANFDFLADGTIRPWLSFERHMAILHALWQHRPTEVAKNVVAPTVFVPADNGDSSWTTNKQAALDVVVHAFPLPGLARVEWMRGDHDLHAQHPEAVAQILLALGATIGGPPR